MRDTRGKRLSRKVKSTAEAVFLQTVPNPVGAEDPNIADSDSLRVVEVDYHSMRKRINLHRVKAWTLADDEDLIAARL